MPSRATTTAELVGAGAIAVPVDVADPASCDALVADAVGRLGAVDVLVTCAGIELGGPATELGDDAWRRVVDVNLSGTFWCARAAARAMIAAGRGGRMVLIGSINSRIALAGQAAYCASKGGVAMLGAALAVDWAADGIAVNTVGPGVVDTPMSAVSLADAGRRQMLMGRTPLGRPAAAERDRRCRRLPRLRRGELHDRGIRARGRRVARRMSAVRAGLPNERSLAYVGARSLESRRDRQRRQVITFVGGLRRR